MPRPHTKELLITECEKEHARLAQYLSSLEPDQMIRPGIVAEWSVKDVLAHLCEWEGMVLNWLETSQSGGTPSVPAEGYKWSQLPALNEEIWRKYRDLPLEEILEMRQVSYNRTLETIRGLPEEMLFTPGLYAWMNKNTLAAYFTSCTSSHYRWALKEIKKGLRASAG